MQIIDRFHNLPTFNPFVVSWLTNNEKDALWKNYLYNRSGQKEESPLLENYVFKDGSLSKINDLIECIQTMFVPKWERLHDALVLEYGVIDNYNRIEDSETTTSGTNNTTGSNDSSDVMTGGHTTNGTNNNIHKVSAFDSSDYVNDNSDNNTTSDTFAYNDETKTTSGTSTSETDTTGSSVTHSVVKGNIGVTTSQQMIESEIELRRFNLYNEMYKDLDSLLTLGVYI